MHGRCKYLCAAADLHLFSKEGVAIKEGCSCLIVCLASLPQAVKCTGVQPCSADSSTQQTSLLVRQAIWGQKGSGGLPASMPAMQSAKSSHIAESCGTSSLTCSKQQCGR